MPKPIESISTVMKMKTIAERSGVRMVEESASTVRLGNCKFPHCSDQRRSGRRLLSSVLLLLPLRRLLLLLLPWLLF